MAKAGLGARRAARAKYQAAKKKPLGEGSRFAAIEESARAGGARNPAAVAATAGRKAHGQRAMTGWAVAGRKRAARKRAG